MYLFKRSCVDIKIRNLNLWNPNNLKLYRRRTLKRISFFYDQKLSSYDFFNFMNIRYFLALKTEICFLSHKKHILIIFSMFFQTEQRNVYFAFNVTMAWQII